MKYFTLEWWNGIQKGKGNDPRDEYDKYFRTIKDKLPSCFSDIHENIYLHDGRITKLEISFSERTLEIRLDTSDDKGNLKEIQLKYSGVISFTSTSDRENALPGPGGYGDLGYHEVELLSDGNLEHRLLFSTGIEFSIQFRDLKLR